MTLASPVGTAEGASSKPVVGKCAPDFSVVTCGGKTVSLADLKGDVMVLNSGLGAGPVAPPPASPPASPTGAIAPGA